MFLCCLNKVISSISLARWTEVSKLVGLPAVIQLWSSKSADLSESAESCESTGLVTRVMQMIHSR